MQKDFLNIIVCLFLFVCHSISNCFADNNSVSYQKQAPTHIASHQDKSHPDNQDILKSKHIATSIFHKDSIVVFSLAGIRLYADANSLTHEVTFTAQTLDQSDTHPLRSDMIAVCQRLRC